MVHLAYQALNLTFNPFGELTHKERAHVAVVDIDPFQKYMHKDNFILQLVADHGRGKSTHLLALHREFPHIPYTQLHVNESHQLKNTSHHFIDSIENLSFLRRQKIYRTYNWLAVTTHRDLSLEMKCAKKSVQTIWINQSSTENLLAIFNKRIEYARRADGVIPLLTLDNVRALQQQYGADIRAMEHQLYDDFYEKDKQAIKEYTL